MTPGISPLQPGEVRHNVRKVGKALESRRRQEVRQTGAPVEVGGQPGGAESGGGKPGLTGGTRRRCVMTATRLRDVEETPMSASVMQEAASSSTSSS